MDENNYLIIMVLILEIENLFSIGKCLFNGFINIVRDLQHTLKNNIHIFKV